MTYLREILECRHFWLHLARSEVRSRFRRSRLGILWAVLQPLLLTLLLVVVFGAIFRVPAGEFALFVFSGLIVWEFLSNSVIGGCTSLLSADPYIKLRRLPIVIYPLRIVLASAAVTLLGFCGLVLWVLVVKPGSFGPSWLTLVVSLPLVGLTGWALAINAAFVNTKFRDFQQFVGLLLQAVWYVSPVFLEPRFFRAAKLGALVDYNPVAHLLELVRAPLLAGQVPTGRNYLFSLGLASIFWLLAVRRITRDERRIVFYL